VTATTPRGGAVGPARRSAGRYHGVSAPEPPLGAPTTPGASFGRDTGTVGYVLVTGLPASGKSTLAGPLSRALDLPLLAKDTVKEALWEALGPGDAEWAARLGAASAEVLLAVAIDAGAAVVDHFFHRDRLTAWSRLPGRLVEVHCAVSPDLARARYQARRRHPAHHDGDAARWDDWIARDAGPLRLGGPLLEVDTSRPVAVAGVAAWAGAALRGEG